MRISFLYLIVALTVASPSMATTFKISVGKAAVVDLSIVSSTQNKSPHENYFHGVKSCQHTSKCLEFHTSAKGSEWAQVPINTVDLINEEDFAADLAKLGVSAQKEKKQGFDWGFVSFWMAAQSSAHYFYLIPKDRTYGLRIGPISDALLSNYDFQFQKISWKFKD